MAKSGGSIYHKWLNGIEKGDFLSKNSSNTIRYVPLSYPLSADSYSYNIHEQAHEFGAALKDMHSGATVKPILIWQ
jgi:hypothetical protein